MQLQHHPQGPWAAASTPTAGPSRAVLGAGGTGGGSTRRNSYGCAIDESRVEFGTSAESLNWGVWLGRWGRVGLVRSTGAVQLCMSALHTLTELAANYYYSTTQNKLTGIAHTSPHRA